MSSAFANNDEDDQIRAVTTVRQSDVDWCQMIIMLAADNGLFLLLWSWSRAPSVKICNGTRGDILKAFSNNAIFESDAQNREYSWRKNVTRLAKTTTTKIASQNMMTWWSVILHTKAYDKALQNSYSREYSSWHPTNSADISICIEHFLMINRLHSPILREIRSASWLVALCWRINFISVLSDHLSCHTFV